MEKTIKQDDVNPAKLVGIIAIVVIVAIILFSSFYTIEAGHRGVLLTFGKPSPMVMSEGLHFKIPIAQSVVKMEVRTQKVEVKADSSSKDLQDVQTEIALNFHLQPGSVNKLYQEVGLDYRERIIDPAIQEAIKSVSAQYTAEELITKRNNVKAEVKELLRDRLNEYHITVDDFNIINFQFSAEFDKAIESKVTAEQLKLKAEMDLLRIEVEAKQTIEQAKAEAEALKLQKAVITPELVELRKIEMMSEAIEKWDGKMPEATSGMPFIDVTPKMMN